MDDENRFSAIIRQGRCGLRSLVICSMGGFSPSWFVANLVIYGFCFVLVADMPGVQQHLGMGTGREGIQGAVHGVQDRHTESKSLFNFFHE